MRITERADSRRLSRADFLRLSGLTATAVLLGTGELQSGRAYAAPSFAADPFSLGVASGDPEHNSVVLWTRLARVVPPAGLRPALGATMLAAALGVASKAGLDLPAYAILGPPVIVLVAAYFLTRSRNRRAALSAQPV